MNSKIKTIEESTIELLNEKYRIALQIKDYDRAKKFLLRIKSLNEKTKG